jgi:5-methylcytosine-specific restriction enzyme subunit McrC
MPQVALTAFEHQPIPISADGDATSLSEAEAERLLWVSDNLRGFCSRGYQSVKLSEHCGLLNLGGRTLEILPKVGERADASAGRGVLLRLLRHASELPLHRQSAAGQGVRPAPLLEVFISAFFDEVLILLKGGLLRRYVEQEDDILAVRGGIRLQRQFTTLANRTDLVACRFDELTSDNRWNRLLKTGLQTVRPWIQNLSLQRTWFELSAAFEEVSPISQPRALLEGLRYDRQAARYRPAILWVERILNLLSPDFRAGEKAAPGLLFNMNLLFERTVEQRMARWAEARGWTLESQDDSRFFTRITATIPRFAYRVRPDLVLRSGGRVIAVADTKWKRPELSAAGFVLPAQPDLYQLHAYASVFGCIELALIYPWDDHLTEARETVFHLPATGGAVPHLTVFAVDLGEESLPLRFTSLGAWAEAEPILGPTFPA